MEEVVSTDAPSTQQAPLSQAVRTGDLVFTSGQTPRDPETRAVVGDTVAEQTDRVMRNLSHVLTAAGTSFDSVVKTTVYLTDMNDYAAFNEVYLDYVADPYPARSVVKVAGLSPGVRVEVELVAEC
jgi:2-iminobutanoate/2-iminopropanoate deaminase